ncbi:hypothetical protein [Lentilitoribacter sp. EG35]|uniref:hypothetical protein n=1 Tax=Lentilitoribacter sp. EG35 TaxID=3234192 RepID=UPI0034613FB0
MPKQTIPLTGRKNLAQSDFNFDWQNDENGTICIFEILNQKAVQDFPANSRVRVLMTENKNVYIADFGTLEKPNSTFSFEGVSLNDVKPELRIVSEDVSSNGLLLGSTKLPKTNKNGDTEGILHFQLKDTSPFLWELSMSENDFPVLYVNENIESAITWVKSDPVFLISVFPVVIEQVFTCIFKSDSGYEEGWMYEWVQWVEQSMGCKQFPKTSNNLNFFQEWLDDAKSTILAKMNLLPDAIGKIDEQGEEK